MSMIQIRNVPEDLHRKLKARAALEGVTLSELALTELSRAMSAPSPTELRETLAHREVRPYGGETASESVRAERGLA
jgi:plasmid stability protein